MFAGDLSENLPSIIQPQHRTKSTHELVCFVNSMRDMQEYDSEVQYVRFEDLTPVENVPLDSEEEEVGVFCQLHARYAGV